MNMSELPDFFAIDHLAKALWRDGESRGAALLVGSGFSRLATLPGGDSKKAPLWNDLRQSIISQIYGSAKEDEFPTDPLRLAEEYRAMLGQAALDDFIRTQTPDRSWEPGELHELLLRLPWTDVLTTNWDTLLERAASNVSEIAYEEVLTGNDLARARPPRIVKLHGTLPSGPFIFAEEDYRTYPTRHAEFVNLARQVFLENELCLVGFSGNDPNFLQWSGWVRDHLGGGARRIYLVGVLNLHPAARRLLELRNVAPVDLGPLVAKVSPAYRHVKAMKLFLEYLHSSKPRPMYAWSPQQQPTTGITAEQVDRRFKDKAYAAELIVKAAETWRIEREGYPGWLVCPSGKRAALRYATDNVLISKDALNLITPEQRNRALFELAWRFDKAYWPIPDFLFDAFFRIIEQECIADPTKPKDALPLSLSEYLDLAAITLRAARHSSNLSAFNKIADVIGRYSDIGTDHRAELAYQKCLNLRDNLQYADLLQEVASIQGPDPIWSLRQANIRCELSDFAGGKKLILAALTELRSRQQRDRNSLWLLSRRAWAEFLARAALRGVYDPSEEQRLDRDRDWPLDFKGAKCDPWDELKYVEDAIERRFREQEKKNFDAKPHFDAGTYIEGASGVHFQSWTNAPPNYELDRLAEDAGLPVSIDMASIRGDSSKNALAISFEPTEDWYLRLFQTLRSHEDTLIDRHLDRASVAKLPTTIAQPLLDKCVAAIQFWRTRTMHQRPDTIEKHFNTHAIEKIRFLTEAISRLVIRSGDQEARTLFDFALGLSKDSDLQHWWLWEPIGHLLKRCTEAMSKVQKAELALTAIQFPLPNATHGIVRDWPRPLEYIAMSNYDRTQNATAWTIRINELIEAVTSSAPSERVEAAHRLSQLHRQRLLTAAEEAAFGDALYTQLDERNLPANTNLYAFTFINLPSPAPETVKTRFADWAYRKAKDGKIDEDILICIHGAARRRRPDDVSVLPSKEDGLIILDSILAWRPPENSFAVPFDLDRGRPKRIAREIGPCLLHGILPLLKAEDLTEARIHGLFNLISDVPAPSALQTLPFLLSLNPDLEDRVTRSIRRAMMGSNFDCVSGATAAMARWSADPGFGIDLPRSLIEQLLLAISARQATGLAALLWCANRLLRTEKLTTTDKATLAETLADLHIETQYNRVDSQPLLISLSVVRAECTRLAYQLSAVGITSNGIAAWLDSYRLDPLPEVRFALDSAALDAS
ncbi:hypothetical protein DNX69_25045 [Rhodopseudomonas palustris]|uniref:Uncharacterized protein n=1 Tax=Rhodopseudomonas palustris TaxID=1076 RepID=A0A323UD59_RHOPL|nr:SIR2 family protein [Rhodopseudomonas palustris]PZA09370.1 hypothetical protein DNX69_25045 [Rhodopseudomonas palustris]